VTRPGHASITLVLCALILTLQASQARAQTSPDPDDGGSGFRLAGNGRPTLDLPFGEIQFRGRVAGTVQAPTRDRGRVRPDPGWQTRRLQVEGTLFKRLEFEVSREFGDADEPERDAFANLRISRALELRAGQFKVPFGRDALIGGANLDFVYRSLAGRQLAPGRDLGVMAHGRVAGRHVTYQAGVFRKDGDNARTDQTRGGRNALAGRVVVTPLAGRNGPLAALQLGAAVVTSQLDDQLGLRGRTVFSEGVFFDRVFVNGRRVRRGVEAGWAHGPVSLSWEHMHVSDQRTGMGADGGNLPGISASGWYVAGTWVITGERKDGRVEPAHSVFVDGNGAFELTARVERLAFAPSTPAVAIAPPAIAITPNADRAITLGLGWYLNRQIKITGNAVFESVSDPHRSPEPQDGRLPTAVVQFQFAL
jgi:phosphate-selective porin OprO and OprP